MNPRDPALALLDPGRMRGLEVGPLHRPRVTKSDGDVRYVDHLSTNELRESYKANTQTLPHLDEIVEVDYVIKEGASISQVAGAGGPFDYVIGSHVIEHIANPIGWLRDVEQVLSDQGLVSLVVPDKRFCFDVNRLETRPQDWIDWYLRDLHAPSYSHLFDFFAHVTTIDGSVDTAGIWAGTANYAGVRRSDVPDPDASAYAICLEHKQLGQYIDVHVGVYTPAGFLSLLELVMKLGLLNFDVAYFCSTPRDTLEFYVTLRKVPPDSLDRQLASIGAAQQVIRDAPACQGADPQCNDVPAARATGMEVSGNPGNAGILMTVSDKERRAILAKRTTMDRLRQLRPQRHPHT